METLHTVIPESRISERRRYERHAVKEGGIALLNPPGPTSTVVGHIIDISNHGLSFRYVAEGPVSTGVSKITIASPESRVYLRDLPMLSVSDFEIAKMPFGSLSPRRHSLKFGALTKGQESDLKRFIHRYAM